MSHMNVDLLSELLHLPAPWRIEGWEIAPMFEQHCIAVLLSCRTVTAAQRLLGIGESKVALVRRRAVQRGLQRSDLSGLQRGGLDEKSFLRGQSSVTVLSDVEQSCVVEVTQGRRDARRRRRNKRCK